MSDQIGKEIETHLNFITIAGGITATALSFVFGWIIKIIRNHNKIENTVGLLSKDIEYLKRDNENINKKIESIALDVGELKLSVRENNTVSLLIQKDIKMILEKME